MTMRLLEKEYIQLSKLFGACLDMVQGKGGNISIKDSSTLIIKQSGFIMSDTDDNKGYLLCDLKKIQEKFLAKDENLLSCVVSGHGRPSMETFFHSLPPKYIVHVHPTSFMKYLCQDDLSFLLKLYPHALCIPYVQPGYDLSEVIQKVYEGQSLIFLKNHGVIFLEESLDSLLHLIFTTFDRLAQELPFLRISDLRYIYEAVSKGMYRKPSYLLPSPCRIPQVYSYTPDYHLFLSNFDSHVTIQHGEYYITGNSKDEVELFEQMFRSYLLCSFDISCNTIPLTQTHQLEQNPLEQQRVMVSKQLIKENKG